MSGQKQNPNPLQSALNDAIPKPPSPSELDWQIAAASSQHSDTDTFGISTTAPPNCSDRDGQNAVAAQSLPIVRSGVPIPRPPTPTELDWHIAEAYRDGKHVAFDIPPPPPSAPKGQDTNHEAMTKRIASSNSDQNSLFAPFSHPESVYKNASLTNFPVAGQVKDGKLVKNSKFEADTSMEADGVQHSMYAGWQHQGESGVHSQAREWFEKRE